jgi:hypothetical protein
LAGNVADEWRALLDEAGVTPTPPQHTAAASAAAGFGQGISSGWTDELGAAVDTGLSKIPGVRNLAESLNQAGGGHPGLSPLTADVPYQQRVDEYRARNTQMRDQHPVASAGGQLVGTAAQAFAPVIGAARAPTIAGTAASGAVQGAGAGLGYNENPEDAAKDTLVGTGVGAAAGTLGGVAQKFAAGAPARNEARQLNTFGVTPKVAGKAQARGGLIASRSDDVINLLRKAPDIKAAAGDPAKVVAAVDKSLQPLTARTQQIYAATDAATKLGGMEQPQLLGPLNQALAKAEGSGADVAYVNRLRRVIDQVRSLAVPVAGAEAQKGSQVTVIPTAKLRAFITDKLAPTTHESETGAAQAVDDAAVVLKDALHGFVGKQSGAATAKELQALDKDVSTHLILKEAAARQFDKTRYTAPTPKPVDAAKRAVGAGLDAVAGAGGSQPARTLEEGARRLTVQRFLDAVDADDRDAGVKALEEGIFGDYGK